METRSLGRSGLKVTPLCLGTMMFGDQTDEEEAKRIVEDARERGINFIDTADVYAKGRSEEIVGRLIAEDRHDWVMATKVGNTMRPDAHGGGLSRKWLFQAVEDSLNRLQSDVIDIYYLHLDDPTTPLEETLTTLKDLLAQNKILHWGVSNYRAWRIVEMIRIADALEMARPVVCQPYYNAMNRMPEVEILPACAHFGLGVVPYSPLARGILTGKYRPGATPQEGTRAGRADKRMMETEFREESMEIAQQIKQRAEAAGRTPIDWAVAWVLANPLIHSVLAGPRTFEQWQGYATALDYSWSAEEEEFLNALVAPGHPSTPGYNDPRYPIAGRPPG